PPRAPGVRGRDPRTFPDRLRRRRRGRLSRRLPQRPPPRPDGYPAPVDAQRLRVPPRIRRALPAARDRRAHDAQPDLGLRENGALGALRGPFAAGGARADARPLPRPRPVSSGSRIAALDARRLDLPLKEPFEISRGAKSALANVLVRVTLRDGTVGWGEGA